jgi:type I restriction enzyme S subunit
MLDLAPDHLAEVLRILALHLSGHEVWAFGSRVTGKAKPFSDLDLVVMGDAPLDFRQLAALKDAFAESNLPFRVDLVEWATTAEDFRAIIEQCYEIVLKANS